MKIRTNTNNVDDYRILNVLWARGAYWFVSLCSLWQERTGLSPVAVADHVGRVNRRRNGWVCIPLIIAVAAYLGMMGVLLAASFRKTVLAETVAWNTVYVLSILVILCLVVSLIAHRKCRRGESVYPEESQKFGEYLSNFLFWTDQTPDSLGFASLHELRELAERLLKERAQEIVVLERMKREEQPNDWGAKLDEARRKMRMVHHSLKSLGLAPQVYDRYFREAERELNNVYLPIPGS